MCWPPSTVPFTPAPFCLHPLFHSPLLPSVSIALAPGIPLTHPPHPHPHWHLGLQPEDTPHGAMHSQWGPVAEERPLALVEREEGGGRELHYSLAHRLCRETSRPGCMWVGLLAQGSDGLFRPTGADGWACGGCGVWGGRGDGVVGLQAQGSDGLFKPTGAWGLEGGCGCGVWGGGMGPVGGGLLAQGSYGLFRPTGALGQEGVWGGGFEASAGGVQQSAFGCGAWARVKGGAGQGGPLPAGWGSSSSSNSQASVLPAGRAALLPGRPPPRGSPLEGPSSLAPLPPGPPQPVAPLAPPTAIQPPIPCPPSNAPPAAAAAAAAGQVRCAQLGTQYPRLAHVRSEWVTSADKRKAGWKLLTKAERILM